jgi:hypothetical protein
MQDSKASVERVLYNNPNTSTFPFHFVRRHHSRQLAKTLRKFEHKIQTEPLSDFVTALNAVLVWVGARTASLPAWNYCDEAGIARFIDDLNAISLDVPKYLGPVAEVTILHRPQVYRSGDGIEQGLVTRVENPRVRYTTDPPVRDDEIGRELDMYHPNVDNFANACDSYIHFAFSIWEVGSDALLYAEAWCEELLTEEQLQEFLVHGEKRVSMWNVAMEKLGLSYRFYGSLDWNRTELPDHHAEKTIRLYGTEFIGAEKREYRGVAKVLTTKKMRALLRYVSGAA